MILVQVLPFGVLKEWLGSSPASVELPEGSSVADLLAHLSAARPTPLLSGIAVSVNAEFASALQKLQDGDEIGLLPPVSGGSAHPGQSAARAAVPAITALRARFEAERGKVLDEAGNDADKATRLLIARLLHDPSEEMKGVAAEGAEWLSMEKALRKLFRLDL